MRYGLSLQRNMRKHGIPQQWDDNKEGGRCHRVEINTLEHDRMKRGELAGCIIDGCRIGLLRWSRHGVREHLRLYLIFSTLHLTLQHCEFVRGKQAEELLTLISSCQFISVSEPSTATQCITQNIATLKKKERCRQSLWTWKFHRTEACEENAVIDQILNSH